MAVGIARAWQRMGRPAQVQVLLVACKLCNDGRVVKAFASKHAHFLLGGITLQKSSFSVELAVTNTFAPNALAICIDAAPTPLAPVNTVSAVHISIVKCLLSGVESRQWPHAGSC